jgi:4-hydroxymandelate oxidase
MTDAADLPALINLDDLAREAARRLPTPALDYYRSGARDESTLHDNRAAFGRWRLRPRVLVDVSQRDPATTVLGQPVRLPLLVAPTAFQSMAWPQGELATARACARAGTVMTLSTLSTWPMEAVVAAWREAGGPEKGGAIWFQLYVYKDRDLCRALVERAHAAGCQALVVTVDAPILGTRERDVRNRFRLPDSLNIADLLDAAGMAGEAVRRGKPTGSQLADFVYQVLDPALTWADIAWLRSISPLPIVLKGVLRGDDARRAVDVGCAGILVSNHGGRQLDGAIAALDALPEVVAAVDGQAEVYMDGGLRRGTDLLKALALGAQAAFIGRPMVWGLSVAGEAGVSHVLGLLRAELDEAMALCGCPTVADIGPDLLCR